MKRIGIFSGTFDPVHSGHICFALQAMEKAGLDQVLFLPERHPRNKEGVTHYAHRLAMLKSALKAHANLGILELPDRQLYPKSVARLNGLFPDDELFLLFGSDVVYSLHEWPLVEVLLKRCSLIIGMRGKDREKTIRQKIKSLPGQPPETHILISQAPQVSSRLIREAMHQGEIIKGLLASVKKYSKEHWLYKRIP